MVSAPGGERVDPGGRPARPETGRRSIPRPTRMARCTPRRTRPRTTHQSTQTSPTPHTSDRSCRRRPRSWGRCTLPRREGAHRGPRRIGEGTRPRRTGSTRRLPRRATHRSRRYRARETETPTQRCPWRRRSHRRRQGPTSAPLPATDDGHQRGKDPGPTAGRTSDAFSGISCRSFAPATGADRRFFPTRPARLAVHLHP